MAVAASPVRTDPRVVSLERQNLRLLPREAIPETIDLITLDLNMPSLDGLTVAEAIRKSPLNEKTPVIVVSAYLSEGVMSELRGKGISRFLNKPFFPDELIAEVKQALECKG